MEHLIKLLEIKQNAIAMKVTTNDKEKRRELFIEELDQAIEETKKQSTALQMYKENVAELNNELLEMEITQGKLEEQIECRNTRIEMLEERNKETTHKLIEAKQLIEILEKENKDLKAQKPRLV